MLFEACFLAKTKNYSKHGDGKKKQMTSIYTLDLKPIFKNSMRISSYSLEQTLKNMSMGRRLSQQNSLLLLVPSNNVYTR